jgi:hypothetical protein
MVLGDEMERINENAVACIDVSSENTEEHYN